MAFSESTLNELRRELHECEQRAALLRKLVESATISPSAAPVSARQAAEPRRRGRPKRTTRPAQRSASQPSDNTGFREALRRVIREHPGIIRKEITANLRRLGIAVRGTTSLSTRVYNDLWRLEQNGEVGRTETGGYTIPSAA